MSARRTDLTRETRETKIRLELDLDAPRLSRGNIDIDLEPGEPLGLDHDGEATRWKLDLSFSE